MFLCIFLVSAEYYRYKAHCCLFVVCGGADEAVHCPSLDLHSCTCGNYPIISSPTPPFLPPF
jgi:hypothetical protein